MNKTRFLWGFFLALTVVTPAAVFADVPGISHEERQRRYEERMGLSRIQPAANVRVSVSENGRLELNFEFNGPGEFDYILHGPKTGKEAAPVAASGHRIVEKPGLQVLGEEVILPALNDNECASYSLEATFRLKVLEKTNFGVKETDREQEERVVRNFILRRQNGVYSVVQ